MSGFPESLLSGSSVTFCHASFGPCQLALWHGITQTILAPQGPPAYAISHTHIHFFLFFFLPLSHPLSPTTSSPTLSSSSAVLFVLVFCRSHRQCICPSCFADQLRTATGGGRRVTPGLRCNLRGRATWVLVITAKCLGRADLFLVGTDWDSG